MVEIIVDKNEAGQRLDKLLFKYLNQAPSGFIFKMIRKKNIVLNDKRAKGSEILTQGDHVRLYLADDTISKFRKERATPLITCSRSLDIIYEDENVMILNKPAGLLSQKAERADVSLVDEMIAYLIEKGEITSKSMETFIPGICNRLDRNTSGIVVAGVSLSALQILSDCFRDRTIHKYYHAIVAGRISESCHIEGFLKKDKTTNTVSISRDGDGDKIVTEYKPLITGTHYTLLEVNLVTGKTHQIRAHLASIGHPIIGDKKYGNRHINDEIKKKYEVNHQLLHAYRIVFPDMLPSPLEYLQGREFIADRPEIFKKFSISR